MGTAADDHGNDDLLPFHYSTGQGYLKRGLFVTCTRCKADFSDDFAFCPMCGKAVAEKPKKKRRRANGEGTVYKRGSTYTARVIFGYEAKTDGKIKVLKRDVGGFKTMREAYAKIPEIRAEGMQKRTVHGVDYRKITFEELYQKFIERHAKRVTKSTLQCYTSAHKYYSDIYGLPFADLNTEDWQLCIDDCPHGIRTKQNMKALGTLMYKLAAELRVFGVNTDTDFASLVWLPSEDSESRKPFTPEELGKIKTAVASGVHGADWILAMCYTGFRPSEFLALKKSDFDAEHWTLRGGAKTEAGKNRLVPVHQILRPIIAKRMLIPGEYLFSSSPDKPMTINTFRQSVFYPALEEAGIQPIPSPGDKPERTPYSTRHTFATLMKSVEGSDKDKAALMGHTSYEMTLHYQHEDYDSLRGIINRIA